jgi:hypothetical protein
MATFILNIAKPLFGKDERSRTINTACESISGNSFYQPHTLYASLSPNLIELVSQLD